MVSWIERITGPQTKLSPKQKFENKLKEIDKLVEEFEFDQNVSGIAHHNQEELYAEFCKLITLSNRLKSISLNPILRNWKSLSFIAKDIISTLLILKKNNLSPEQIKEIRVSIEEQIIECELRFYPPPTKFLSINHNRAMNSKYFIRKMVYGLTISSSVSLFIFVACFGVRWVILQSKQKDFEWELRFNKRELAELRNDNNEIKKDIEIETKKELPDQAIINDLNDRKKSNDKNIEQKTKSIKEVEQKAEEEMHVDLILLLIIAISSGALGSTISMIVRIQEFDSAEKNYNDPSIPILIGIYRPLIGASFSLFIF